MVQPTPMPDGCDVLTPIVPVTIGDDWQAVLFWKALYDEGVYANVALYPAVQRGGALLRTSVMATHERDHLDRALAAFDRSGSGWPTARGRAGPWRASVASGAFAPACPARAGARSARDASDATFQLISVLTRPSPPARRASQRISFVRRNGSATAAPPAERPRRGQLAVHEREQLLALRGRARSSSCARR